MIWAEYVRDVDDDDKKWAYQTCKGCGKEISPSGIWYCKKCLNKIFDIESPSQALNVNWDCTTAEDDVENVNSEVERIDGRCIDWYGQ
jgi:hypothetical protein